MSVKRTTDWTTGAAGDTVFPQAAEAGVILLDLSFQAIAMDSGAASILAAVWDDGTGREDVRERTCCLPPDVMERMRRSELADLGSIRMRFNARNRLYIARAYLAKAQDGILPQMFLVVHLERDSGICNSLLQVSLKYRLTGREQEALAGLAVGLTSKELADRMKISPSTVKAFLRVIMIKMGVTNRAGIVAKLLTTSNSEEVLNAAGFPGSVSHDG